MQIYSEEYSLEYYPQKIIHWMKSYNIPFKILKDVKDYKPIIDSLPITTRTYYKMSIEKTSPEIEFDNINECVFSVFLIWNGGNYNFREEVMKSLYEK